MMPTLIELSRPSIPYRGTTHGKPVEVPVLRPYTLVVDTTPRRSPGFRFLSAAAFLSGASALALELLWGRELARAFGASQYAVAAVLAAFMLGLGLGSAAGGPLADRSRNPARLLAGLELGLVLLGPATTVALLRLPEFTATLLPAANDASQPGFWLPRAALALLTLLLPTAIMGATFPATVRAAAENAEAIPGRIAALYGWNTLGGVAGAIGAGFLVLPHRGIPGVAIGATVANLTAGALAWRAGRFPATTPDTRTSRATPSVSPGTLLLGAAALSGALVLGAEAVWNRALEVTLANSTWTFTLLLALFLAGLGAGGRASGPLLRRHDTLRLFAALETIAALLLTVGAALLPVLPHLVRVVRPAAGWGRVLAAPLAVGGTILLPLAVVLGAAWPALLAAAAPRLDDAGRRIGRMGLANALGAAAGPMVATWLLLPALGFGRTVLVLALSHGALAALVLPHRTRRPVLVMVCALGVLVVAALPRFGRVLLPSVATGARPSRILFYRETPAAVVTVTVDPTGRFRSMFVDNNAAIGTTYDALKVTRMLGVLPVLLTSEPHDALVVGLGAGVTTATIAAFPEVESIEVAELVPAVADAARLFSDLNHDVLDDPRVHLVLDDGRNHLLLSDRRYDLITCDPVHPLYGSAALYSQDFFRLCRERLRPGGVMCQYLPLHHMPPDAFRRAIGTFCDAFPRCRVAFSLGHAVLIGPLAEPVLDWSTWRERLHAFRYPVDLADSVLSSPGQIAALLTLDPSGCRAVALPPPSTDLHPRLEFLAPAAFEPRIWEANARTLVGMYSPPFGEIHAIPPEAIGPLKRLVAGKRLLLFSMLRLEAGDPAGARDWAGRAVAVAPEDPEVRRWLHHLAEAVTGSS